MPGSASSGFPVVSGAQLDARTPITCRGSGPAALHPNSNQPRKERDRRIGPPVLNGGFGARDDQCHFAARSPHRRVIR
ncbi:hypothetical protein [Cryobacterium aureum]|uniref:hypothetical protein n=1 Tax=Cryobacterium aureum TaxID=995037 RepID=UPI00101ADBA9|nr:hypothetical protein [Cryobacterium aureum]